MGLEEVRLAFYVGDEVLVEADVPSLRLGSKKLGYISYGSTKGRRGRVVQLNFNNFDGRFFSVRLAGRKAPIWFKASELRKVNPLDRLAEIQ